jgi:hypothetical protein
MAREGEKIKKQVYKQVEKEFKKQLKAGTLKPVQQPVSGLTTEEIDWFNNIDTIKPLD